MQSDGIQLYASGPATAWEAITWEIIEGFEWVESAICNGEEEARRGLIVRAHGQLHQIVPLVSKQGAEEILLHLAEQFPEHGAKCSIRKVHLSL